MKGCCNLTLDRQLRPYLYYLEYDNGKEVKRIERQMRAYVEAIKIGSTSVKYDVGVGNRVLNIFKHKSFMKCLVEWMQQDVYFKNMQEHFLFIMLEELSKFTIFTEWRNVLNTELSIFWNPVNLIALLESNLILSLKGILAKKP